MSLPCTTHCPTCSRHSRTHPLTRLGVSQEGEGTWRQGQAPTPRSHAPATLQVLAPGTWGAPRPSEFVTQTRTAQGGLRPILRDRDRPSSKWAFCTGRRERGGEGGGHRTESPAAPEPRAASQVRGGTRWGPRPPNLDQRFHPESGCRGHRHGRAQSGRAPVPA